MADLQVEVTLPEFYDEVRHLTLRALVAQDGRNKTSITKEVLRELNYRRLAGKKYPQKINRDKVYGTLRRLVQEGAVTLDQSDHPHHRYTLVR